MVTDARGALIKIKAGLSVLCMLVYTLRKKQPGVGNGVKARFSTYISALIASVPSSIIDLRTRLIHNADGDT